MSTGDWQAAEDFRSHGQLGSVRNEDEAFFLGSSCMEQHGNRADDKNPASRLSRTHLRGKWWRIGGSALSVNERLCDSVSAVNEKVDLEHKQDCFKKEKGTYLLKNAQIFYLEQSQRQCFHICGSDSFNLGKVKCLTAARSESNLQVRLSNYASVCVCACARSRVSVCTCVCVCL